MAIRRYVSDSDGNQFTLVGTGSIWAKRTYEDEFWPLTDEDYDDMCHWTELTPREIRQRLSK
jgi:hypothetical protein